MTILFDFTRIVKTPAFGRGILPYVPATRAPYTAADSDWAAWFFAGCYADECPEVPPSSEFDEDEEFDRMADEAAFLDRYVRGHVL
jgi:hypothetical protein